MEIHCQHLALGYNKHVLHRNVNFTIPSGSYTAIVGDNGVGKSTLIKTILGLIPPLDGGIELGEGLKNSDIGYLPQQSQAQKDFPASVREVVLSGCLNKMGWRPFYNKAEKARMHEMLGKLGIRELAERSYSELSGGQQQRVLLARALCATSKAILLDEPTASLDSHTRIEFYRLIKSLNEEGITIIIITHHLEQIREDVDLVICLDHCGVNCHTAEDYHLLNANS